MKQKMKRTVFVLAFVCVGALVFAQKKITTSATINFDATTNLNAMAKAENKTVVAAIELRSGGIAFEAVMKSFSFSNPMMQDYFNGDSWLETDKFQTSTFKGKIINLAAINFVKDGTYPAEVAGDLTIHGITKQLATAGSVIINGKAIAINATFTIKLEDYGIKGKAIEVGKVAKEPKITVEAEFK